MEWLPLAGKIFISGCLVATGLYMLFHVKKLAKELQDMYVKYSLSSFTTEGAEFWKTPFMFFVFKVMIVILGIVFLIGASAPFGPIYI